MTWGFCWSFRALLTVSWMWGKDQRQGVTPVGEKYSHERKVDREWNQLFQTRMDTLTLCLDTKGCVNSTFNRSAAVRELLCLHRMRSGTQSSVGHQPFGSFQISMHRNISSAGQNESEMSPRLSIFIDSYCQKQHYMSHLTNAMRIDSPTLNSLVHYIVRLECERPDHPAASLHTELLSLK